MLLVTAKCLLFVYYTDTHAFRYDGNAKHDCLPTAGAKQVREMWLAVTSLSIQRASIQRVSWSRSRLSASDGYNQMIAEEGLNSIQHATLPRHIYIQVRGESEIM